MKYNIPILTVTGSDNTGATGIQSDLKTITAMGCDALTSVTAVTVQDEEGRIRIVDMSHEIVLGQVRAIVKARNPVGVKVGMVRDTETIRSLRDEVSGAKILVLVPGIVSAAGERLMSDEAMEAWKRYLIPEASLLMLRCCEAELLLHCSILSDEDMIRAARSLMDMGAKAVFLRGGHQTQGRLTALLYSSGVQRFYSSQNTEGWQRHGVGAALSSAVLARLVLGDELQQAMQHAHDYLHAQVVYSVNGGTYGYRSADVYNRLMSLLAAHYRQAHDVAYYAGRLSVSARYLTTCTQRMVGKSPKAVINDYLFAEADTLLLTTRLSVAEIAYRLGFASPAAFSKWFSAGHSLSPAVYRQQKK